MCLSIPAKVLFADSSSATVLLGSNRYKVSTDLIGEVEKDDYVLIHTGFAIQKLTREDADEMVRLLREIVGNEV